METTACANPLLRPFTCVVDETIETWADDDAAARTTCATVAAALAMVAITRAKQRTVRVALGIAGSATVRRVERLLAGEQIRRSARNRACPDVWSRTGRVLRHGETFFEALHIASAR